MSISISDVGKVTIIKGTEGGDTFEVRMRGSMDAKKLCYRSVNQLDGFGMKMKCASVAGAGTDHLGTGACQFHSGNNVPSFKDGRLATVTRGQLASRIEKFKNQDQADLLDMSGELSTMKAIFEEFIETFPSTEESSYGVHLERVTKMLSTIMRLVDNISKIESRNAITASQVIYLRAVLSDILMKYIEDPLKQKQAAQELVHRVGGRNEYAILESGE